ncbi:MAG: serine/threonine protein kinase [Planctomycetota bacterium]|nr:serine/threonine protein kinase [Planctomycetota bacterium]
MSDADAPGPADDSASGETLPMPASGRPKADSFIDAPAPDDGARIERALASLPGLQVEAKLGEGGMGAVYRARQRSLNRVVAVKVLPAHLAKDRQYLARLDREGKLLAQIQHPNVIACFDMSQHEGLRYVVMEYVDGCSLAGLIKEKGTLPLNEALYLLKQTVQGLDHAHASGVIHRDVKPENLLLAKQVNAGTAILGPSPYIVKIADLGLGSSVSESEQTQITQQGSIMGSPHYMSPEQTLGEKDLDFRTDLFALGCTLLHALTGQRPYDASTVGGVLARKLTQRLPDPRESNPDLPPGACLLIHKMTARRREDRYESYAALMQDLESMLAGRPLRAKPLPNDASCVELSEKTRAELGESATAAKRIVQAHDLAKAARAGGGSKWMPALLGLAVAAGLAILFFARGSSPEANPPVKVATPTPVKPDAPAETIPALKGLRELIVNRSPQGWSFTGASKLIFNNELGALGFDPGQGWQLAEQELPAERATLTLEMTVPVFADAIEIQLPDSRGGLIAFGFAYPKHSKPISTIQRRESATLDPVGGALFSQPAPNLEDWPALAVDLGSDELTFRIDRKEVYRLKPWNRPKSISLRLAVHNGGGLFRNVRLTPPQREAAP